MADADSPNTAADGLSLDPKQQKEFEKKLKNLPIKTDKVQPGIIYVGHIPHGFYEDQMKGFFSQFGDIDKIRLSRSKRSGRSRGYAFIEFADQNVAKIVAETMNNYLMCGRLLKCQLMRSESVHPDTFKGANKKFRKINWRELANKQVNMPRTAKQHNNVVRKLIKAENRRRQKLQNLGIDYQFPGYVASQMKSAEHIIFEDSTS